ncbi:hypothetical protein [Lyngbya aestuarii]|uniref:hypothetical protein n=1 Tax=Lyngbya aestuarii TaxID=118322 RepID=UPI00403E2AA4
MNKSSSREARLVAQEASAIRAALKQSGYETRKQSRQPAWKIFVEPEKHYKLTYKTAPVSTWVLHPDSNDPNRQSLLDIIQNTLATEPAGVAREIS